MQKNISHNVSRNKGFSTIELLIAFSVGMVFLTAALLVSYSDPTLARQISLDSGQATALDAVLDTNALSTSTNRIGGIVSSLGSNWNTIFSSNSDTSYTITPTVTDISPCFKEVIDVTTWNTFGRTGRTMTFGTGIGNLDIAKALGGDCDPFPSGDTWKKPRVFSRHNFNPGKPVSIDVLNRIVYITDDKGRLQIYDSSSDVLGGSVNFSITPYIDAGGKQLNAVDVVKKGSRRYAYVVRDDTTKQFQVIDVTTPGTYTTSASVTLGGTIPPTGSFPQGWRVFYYDDKVYVSTRETAGSEFHIFDVTTPMSPIEVGPGFEINGTANDFFVTSTKINGATYKFAFMATDRSANEVMVVNVTNPSAPSLLASIDLPTTNDALSLQLLGNKLYIGRQKTTSGPELFVYTVNFGVSGSSPTVTLTQVGSGAEINFDTTYLRVTSQFAFIGNSLPGSEFSAWDISNPTSGFARIDTSPLNVNNKIFGLDYETPYIYVGSQANDSLQILYSAP